MDFEFSIKGITLETDRLQLRPWELSDLDDFHAYARVPGVGEMAGWPHHRSIEETRTILRQFMEAGEVLAVYHKKDRKVIGSMGVHPVPQTLPEAFQNRHAKEIGYALSKTYWGQGLTAEALAFWSAIFFALPRRPCWLAVVPGPIIKAAGCWRKQVLLFPAPLKESAMFPPRRHR